MADQPLKLVQAIGKMEWRHTGGRGIQQARALRPVGMPEAPQPVMAVNVLYGGNRLQELSHVASLPLQAFRPGAPWASVQAFRTGKVKDGLITAVPERLNA